MELQTTHKQNLTEATMTAKQIVGIVLLFLKTLLREYRTITIITHDSNLPLESYGLIYGEIQLETSEK